MAEDCTCITNCDACGPSPGTDCACTMNNCDCVNCDSCVNKRHSPQRDCDSSGTGCACDSLGTGCTCPKDNCDCINCDNKQHSSQCDCKGTGDNCECTDQQQACNCATK